jgi:hypothetical protein
MTRTGTKQEDLSLGLTVSKLYILRGVFSAGRDQFPDNALKLVATATIHANLLVSLDAT